MDNGRPAPGVPVAAHKDRENFDGAASTVAGDGSLAAGCFGESGSRLPQSTGGRMHNPPHPLVQRAPVPAPTRRV